ncbi:MAG: hypothetical protein PVJ49_08880 [Acidobacteriota bacterium]
MSEDAERQALAWIVGLLRDLGILFQGVGGLAARAYGATRPLVDLDFYVPTSRLAEVAAAAADRVVRPPTRHRDDDWDITFMALEHDGVRIELGGADDARYFDRSAGCWRDVAIDYGAAQVLEVLGVDVPLMARTELIAYKQALDRPVDRRDLKEILPRAGAPD